jgi:hypothetical protein
VTCSTRSPPSPTCARSVFCSYLWPFVAHQKAIRRGGTKQCGSARPPVVGAAWLR